MHDESLLNKLREPLNSEIVQRLMNDPAYGPFLQELRQLLQSPNPEAQTWRRINSLMTELLEQIHREEKTEEKFINPKIDFSSYAIHTAILFAKKENQLLSVLLRMREQLLQYKPELSEAAVASPRSKFGFSGR